MNCRDFQNQLYEYVEGSLSAAENVEAKAHLAHCLPCGQAVREEQQRVQFLSSRLQQDTAALALRPEVRQSIMASLERQPSQRSVVFSWNRLAWPLGIAASLILVVAISLIQHFRGESSPVSVEVSYRQPVHTFHQEGNQIIDTLSYQTIAINETLWTEKPEKKAPL